jgi:hypothetical protein
MHVDEPRGVEKWIAYDMPAKGEGGTGGYPARTKSRPQSSESTGVFRSERRRQSAGRQGQSAHGAFQTLVLPLCIFKPYNVSFVKCFYE